MVIIGNKYIYIYIVYYIDHMLTPLWCVVAIQHAICASTRFWGLWDLDDIEDLHVLAEASPALRRLAKWLGASLSTWISKLLFKTVVAWLVMKEWINRDFNIWQPCRDIKWIKRYKTDKWWLVDDSFGDSQSMRWVPWPSYWRAVEVMAHRNRCTGGWWLEHVFF